MSGLINLYCLKLNFFQVVKFSPDSHLVSLGSRDNNIYIYQVGEDMRKYSRVGRCAVSTFYMCSILTSVYLDVTTQNFDFDFFIVKILRCHKQKFQTAS